MTITEGYFVYIIWSEKFQKYYIGSSSDVAKRLLRHNSGGNKFTKAGKPWVVVHQEGFVTKSEALRREKEIKRKKSRKYIEYLIGYHSSVGRASQRRS